MHETTIVGSASYLLKNDLDSQMASVLCHQALVNAMGGWSAYGEAMAIMSKIEMLSQEWDIKELKAAQVLLTLSGREYIENVCTQLHNATRIYLQKYYVLRLFWQC